VHPELVCENISAGYGKAEVLRALSARFTTGGLSCILGPNGAGKSTLLRAVSGYLRLSAGRISFDGEDFTTLTARERAHRIALVPQLAADSVPLTVREAVALARYPHLHGRLSFSGADLTAVDDALAWLVLGALANRPCPQLSGGEWRRVLIAQGVAQGARVLLLDEPTAFLDPPARLQTLALLRNLAIERDMAVIAVLHDPPLARRFADHVLMLRDGAAMLSGPADRVLDKHNLDLLYGRSPDWVTELEVS